MRKYIYFSYNIQIAISLKLQKNRFYQQYVYRLKKTLYFCKKLEK